MNYLKQIKNCIKYHRLVRQTDKQEDYLIKRALKKAIESGLEINIGGQLIVTPNKKEGRVYLAPTSEDKTLITPLLKLISKDIPDEVLEFYRNRRRIELYQIMFLNK